MTDVVVVHTPEGATLDIVFVHGLDGDARQSWCRTEASSFWPMWLAEDFEAAAVWSVGYDAWSSKWRGLSMPMQDRAINLLAQLQNHGIGHRPLCFVTHSMGGLLVKEMLLHSAEGRTDYASFATFTEGVVFLGTPHTGSGVTKLVDALGIVYRGTAAVEDLKRNSPHLRQLNDRYRDWADDAGVRTLVFFETHPTKGVRVVDEASANPGLPRIRPIPVDANHVDICKPSSRSSVVYGQVRRLIARIVRSLADRNGNGSPEAVQSPALFMVPAEIRQERVVARPELLEQVVERLLLAESSSVVAISGIAGAGGFGKTTLAAQVCRDQRVRSRFAENLWLTVGEHASGAELAAKINDLSAQLTRARPSFVDPEQAGHFLNSLLKDKPRLLVIDDVWRASQLTPFLLGEDRCVRLVTTRVPAILPTDDDAVLVDQMTAAQADELVRDGLELPAGTDVQDLLRRTGRWPVLLRLVNRAIVRLVDNGDSTDAAIGSVVRQLIDNGPHAFDARNPEQRAAAVAATVNASLQVLGQSDDLSLIRFLDLAVFPEDTPIPLDVLSVYWARRGGLTYEDARRLCLDFRDLSLVQQVTLGKNPTVRLHDVIRDYLRHSAGSELAQLHREFVEAYRSTGTPWWDLAVTEMYLAENLVYHLAKAGLGDDVTALVCDPRWLAVVLQYSGPAAAERDLARTASREAGAIAEVIRRNAHLLGAIEPFDAMVPLLLSRLASDKRLAAFAKDHLALLTHDYLMPSKPLPDAPHPANVRTIRVTNKSVAHLSIGGTGDCFATASRGSGLIRTWNFNGTPRATFEMDSSNVTALAVSPDGRFLAASDMGFKRSDDGRPSATEVRLWRTDGRMITVASADRSGVYDIAWSPDSKWIVTPQLEFIDSDGEKTTSEITNAVHGWGIQNLAVSPNAAVIAHAQDVTVWLFERSGKPILTFAGHTGEITGVAFTPDGKRIVTASKDGTVRITTLDDVGQIVALDNEVAVSAFAVSSDGDRFATVDDTGRLRLWSGQGELESSLSAHPQVKPISVAFTGDDRQVITGDEEGVVRFWDVSLVLKHTFSPPSSLTALFAMDPERNLLVGSDEAGALVLLPLSGSGIKREIRPADSDLRIGGVRFSGDGRYLVGVGGPRDGYDIGRVFIWSTDGSQEIEVQGHTRAVMSVATSPDGTWFATGGLDGTLRFWERSGAARAVIGDAGWVAALAASPDGEFLVSSHDRPEIRISNPDGTERARVSVEGYGPLRSFAITSDSTTIISGHSGGMIHLWASTGGPIGILGSGGGGVVGLAFSADDRWLASADRDGVVRVWDWRARKCLTATRTDGVLYSVHWYPDGRHVAASGSRGVFELLFQPSARRVAETD